MACQHTFYRNVWFAFYASCAPNDLNAFRVISSGRRQRGHSLAELIVVVAVIGVIAAAAMPSSAPAYDKELTLAGSEVADAFRFAREEAQRTGSIHGVTIDAANNYLRVFRLNEVPDPNVKVFDVHHPLTKQFYTVQYGVSFYRGIELSAIGGQFSETCDDQTSLAFDPEGVIRCIEPVAARINNAHIKIIAGQRALTVAIEQFTGRVTVQ